MNQLLPIATTSTLPVLVTAAGEHARLSFLEFFAANIRNPHTRRAYTRAVNDFLAGAAMPAYRSTWPLPCAAAPTL